MTKRKLLNLRIGEHEREIIKMVGLGVFVLSSIVLPGLPMALAPFIKRRGKKEFHQTIKRLEEKGVLYLHGDKVKLSKRGQEVLQKFQVEEITIQNPQKWDGVWHLVSYDIPDELKKERDWFRETLKRLDFRQVQESLWVYSYECREEIAIIAQNLKISPYVIVMNTGHLPQQKRFERYFDLLS